MEIYCTTNARSLKNRNADVVDPIVNWIGKQLEGQTVPQTITDRLQSNHTNFPSGILVLPTTDDGRHPRILVPKSVQSNLVLQAHLDIRTPSTL
jgi:hypothetical protein